MAKRRHPLRDRILTRAQGGDFAVAREIMLVASVPRQTANRWLREAKIDLSEARLRAVAKMREQEERYLDGLPAVRKPTKAQMRKIATKALKDFNRAQSKRTAETRGRDIGQ